MPFDIKPGDWCYGIRCPNCGRAIAVWPDPSNGRDPICFEGKGLLEAQCPGCRQTMRYQPQQVRHFQAVQAQSLEELSQLRNVLPDDET
jgi:hypothetical protein